MLVTGGAGFVGSHIVDALRAAGHDVRVLDVADRQGDVRDADAVERALDGVDHVCHQAGMVGLGVDFLDVADYVVAQRPRHRGAAARARAPALSRAARAGVEHGRLRRGPLPVRDARPVRPAPRRAADLDAGRFEPRCPRCAARLTPEAIGEDAPADPRNVYAATKLHQEHLAFAFARETGAPVTALRYHNVYGPRMPRDTPYAGVAAIFADALGRGPRAARLRGRRPAARLRPRARRRARQPRWRCWRPSRRRARSTCARARRAASARWRTRCAPRTATRRRPSRSPASTGSATSATCSPQRRSPPTDAGLHRAGRLRHRDGRTRR